MACTDPHEISEMKSELMDLVDKDTMIDNGVFDNDRHSLEEENVVRYARTLLAEEGIDKICLDELDEAMLVFSETHDLDKAAEILVNDTLYWEGVY